MEKRNGGKRSFLPKDYKASEVYIRLMRENETDANMVISRFMLAIGLMYIVAGILNVISIFRVNSPGLYITFFVSGLIMILISVTHKRSEKATMQWVKHISFFMMALAILIINMMSDYKLWMLYTVPILLSVRYYNRKFTSIVALYAELMTVASAVINVCQTRSVSYEIYNHVEITGIGTDILNAFRLTILPNVIIIIIVTVIATRLIDNSMRILMKEHEAHEREIKFLKDATIDGMTGLYNRRAYNDDCAALTPVTMRGLVLVMFDVNGLKAANDGIGHEAGDELINGAASCIDRVMSPYGKAYRWGGDEFAAMIYTDEAGLENITREFRECTAAWSGSLVKSLSISMGSAASREMDGEYTINDMEVLADKRMYEVKKAHYQEKENDRRRQ